jgi:hypothetical protein
MREAGEASAGAVEAVVCWRATGARRERRRTTTKGARSAVKRIVVHKLRLNFAIGVL